jgi:hypothetical protein
MENVFLQDGLINQKYRHILSGKTWYSAFAIF